MEGSDDEKFLVYCAQHGQARCESSDTVETEQKGK